MADTNKRTGCRPDDPVLLRETHDASSAVINSVPVPVIPASITRTATKTGADEAASRTGPNSGRYRLSRANPAILGGIGSLGYSGTINAEEELTKSLGTSIRRRN